MSLTTLFRTQNNMSCLFLLPPTYFLNIIVPTTQTLSQIKSQEFLGQIQKHIITTSRLSYVTNGNHDFVKCCITTFHLRTCFLVDYNQQRRMGRGGGVFHRCALMVDPLSYFSFQPMLRNWCNIGYVVCPAVVCATKSRPWSNDNRFSFFSLSQSLTIHTTPYN